jgi:hypothetical protein
MGTVWFQPDLFAAYWLGLGGCAMGVAGLLEWLRPPGRPWSWLRHATGISSGVFALAALAGGQPAILWGAALTLTLVWLLTWLSRPAPADSLRARIVRRANAPQWQWTAVLLGAPVAALVLSRHAAKTSPRPKGQRSISVAGRFQAIDWQRLPWDRAPVRATTDLGRPIPLFTLRNSARLRGRANQLDAEVSGMFAPTDGMIRTAPPDLGYDCHGWVFTGGHYLISGGDVEKILKDNGYKVVSDPHPGDLAIYRDDAETIRHSGLVVAVTAGSGPLIESKWGYIGRYISPVHTHMYSMDAIFYRSPRKGHRLRGVETE